MELMKMRIPVIASGKEGQRELITDEVTELLTYQGRPQDIAAAIQRLADDKRVRERLIDNASSFSERFNVDEHVKKIEKIYSGVLSDTNRPKR